MAVRNERVVLDLEDNFSTGMARAAMATALLHRELKNLSGQSVVTARVSKNISRDTDTLAKSANKADTSINQLTGRLRLFADVAAVLGPALIPIGAVGIPAVAGLANQFGAAALAGGTAILAFQGVGDALKAVNEASLEPTAANLEKAREAMERLSPAARDMVMRLQELRPVMEGLRDTAATGLFPGLIEALDSLETRVPEVERILTSVASTLGDVVAAGAEGLASSRWDDFFTFLATDVPATLVDLGHIVGDLTHGMAELWMAFDPLNDDFSGWLRDIASGFDDWASGLAQTQGFEEFIDYVRTNGPQVADTFVALADAVLEIVEAAAPLGGPVLAALEAVAKVVAAIADSDLGTPIFGAVAAFAAFNRVVAISEAALGRFGKGSTGFATVQTRAEQARTSIVGLGRDLGVMGTTYMTAGAKSERATSRLAASTERVKSATSTLAKSGAGLAALGLAASGVADKMGLANTATLGLVGTMAGAKWGVVGAAAGGIMDLSNALSVGADEMDRFIRVLTAEAGPNPGDQIAAVTDEIARLEGVMGDSHGLSLGFTKLWSDDGAARAAERVEYLRGALEELQTQQEITIEENRRAAIQGQEAWVAMQKQAEAASTVAGRLDAVGNAITNLDNEGDLLSTAAAAEELATALETLLGPALGAEEATDAFKQGLRGMREEMEGTTRTFKGYTEAAITNRQVTRDRAQELVAMLSAQAKAGASSKELARSLQDSKRAFIEEGIALGFSRKQMVNRARAMGLTPKLVRTVFEAAGLDASRERIKSLVDDIEKLPKEVRTKLEQSGYELSRKQINDLAQRYELTPKQVRTLLQAQDNASKVVEEVNRRAEALHRRTTNPNITADAGPAISSMNAVESRMNALNGKTSRVVIYQDTIQRVFRVPGGGRIPLASGGLVAGPGTATSDSIPADLSNGEYVVRAAAVQRYGKEMFDRLNAMSFANGGFVAPLRVPPPRVTVSTSVAAPVAGRSVMQTFNVSGADVRDLARRIEQRERDAMAVQVYG